MNKFTENFTDLEKPGKTFTIGIDICDEKYTYVFCSYLNREYTTLLMKDIPDEREFVTEILSLRKIFDAAIYSDTLDFNKLFQKYGQ